MHFFKGARTAFFARLFLIYLVLQAALRSLLFVYTGKTAYPGIADILATFFLGGVYDTVTLAQGLLPLFLLFVILPAAWLKKKPVKIFINSAVFLQFFIIIFTFISEFFFWQEFQTKFNFIAVDYLIYTTEVIGNISQAYNLWLILPAIALAAAILTFWQSRLLNSDFAPLSGKQRLASIALAAILPFAVFYTVNSKWRESVSSNRYAVEISGNGAYEFFSAFRNNELDYDKFYVVRPTQDVINGLQKLLATKDATFADNSSTLRHITASRPEQTPNIIMIVVESLSSDFLGVFGNNEQLTPNLDKLARESMFFTNVYATGTRTVRGLEALSLAVPPTPGQSILRRPDFSDLFTLGSVLKEKNYVPEFIYGGYGYFDNMNAFFAGNGYAVTDRTDLTSKDIYFENVWGVADEIIFNHALADIDKRTANNEKVFQLIMTTSNHSPYTYPAGRIDIPSPGGRPGAVKYTDWAIGDFIEKARSKPWFDNTVFVIIADHQASSAGKVDLPVSRYHIPLIIYAPKLIPPSQNDRLMSQIDLPPTLLGLLGFSYDSRFFGYDINQLEPGRERAFISTYQNIGFIKDGKLVILKPQKQVYTYKIDDFKNSVYTPIPNDDALTSQAIEWYQGASHIYQSGLLSLGNK